MKILEDSRFRRLIGKHEVALFTLRNGNGCVAQFTNYGARWLSMWIPDKNNQWGDVLLGFDCIDDYLTATEKYYGAVIGRVCGRIGGAKFSLNGTAYPLSENDLFGSPTKNHLHGGNRGFSARVWSGKLTKNELGEDTLTLTYFSEDGEEGYPGNLTVKVTYTLSQDNAVIIRYSATTDQPTVINLTNHAYFDLSGGMSQNVLDHALFIAADKAVDCDHELIPTGKIISVRNTPVDFTAPEAIGSRLQESFPGQLFPGKGYAVNYILNRSEIPSSLCARVAEPKSGRVMEVYTDQPCLQFYHAWLFDGSDIGKNNKRYRSSAGMALEAQGYTDAPNHPDFPSIVLMPGATYRQETIYKFTVQSGTPKQR